MHDSNYASINVKTIYDIKRINDTDFEVYYNGRLGSRKYYKDTQIYEYDKETDSYKLPYYDIYLDYINEIDKEYNDEYKKIVKKIKN